MKELAACHAFESIVIQNTTPKTKQDHQSHGVCPSAEIIGSCVLEAVLGSYRTIWVASCWSKFGHKGAKESSFPSTLLPRGLHEVARLITRSEHTSTGGFMKQQPVCLQTFPACASHRLSYRSLTLRRLVRPAASHHTPITVLHLRSVNLWTKTRRNAVPRFVTRSLEVGNGTAPSDPVIL